ncbi:MAG: hypothetical protein LBS19_01235 [Clostridiales bacterium]|jgi:uncharacterized protein YukE|nr:hypothetical protein [Clostridiales bacterium]
MAMINVDRRALKETAAAVKQYCELQNRQMKEADGEVKSMLASGWMGEDAMAFGRKWDDVDSKDSVTTKLHDSLDSFREALLNCEKLYSKAQEDSYDQAEDIIRLIVW